MDIGTAHFTMIITTGPAGHEAVAEIDQTAKRYKREKDGLFQSDRVRAAYLFFKDASFADMSSHSHIRFIQKDGLAEEAAFEFDCGTELTVFNRYRRLVAQLTAGGDDRSAAIYSTTRINLNTFFRNLVGIDFFSNIERSGVGNFYTTLN